MGFYQPLIPFFYGRISYDSWGNFQSDGNAGEAEVKLWQGVHAKKKYVFSRQNRQDDKATFIITNFEKEVAEIKNQPGKDIWLYGGASLIKSFIRLGLIDIYRISVHPIVLGSGKPLFEDLKESLRLDLIETNTFKSGVVQLIYKSKI